MQTSERRDIEILIGKKYLVGKQLGKGSFGTVYYCVNKQSSQQYAVKCVNKQKFIQNQRNPQLKQYKEKILQDEVEIMTVINNFSNRNVVGCYDIINNENYQLFVLEYCNKGNLNQEYSTQILGQLLVGFASLQKNKIMHRDIKTQNILIHNDVFKIADLGLSKRVESLTKSHRGTTLGTKITMAPQVSKHQQYSVQADIWSLGVVYYQMLTGQLPFIYVNQQTVNTRIQSLQQLNISQDCKDLLKRFFIIDPNKRLSWKQLYKMFNNKQGVFQLIKSIIPQPILPIQPILEIQVLTNDQAIVVKDQCIMDLKYQNESQKQRQKINSMKFSFIIKTMKFIMSICKCLFQCLNCCYLCSYCINTITFLFQKTYKKPCLSIWNCITMILFHMYLVLKHMKRCICCTSQYITNNVKQRCCCIWNLSQQILDFLLRFLSSNIFKIKKQIQCQDQNTTTDQQKQKIKINMIQN